MIDPNVRKMPQLSLKLVGRFDCLTFQIYPGIIKGFVCKSEFARKVIQVHL